MNDKHKNIDGTSRANDRQTRVAMRLVKIFREAKPNLNIGLLALYTHQMREMEKLMEDPLVEVSSVDSYQGKEVDVEILVTTKASDRKAIHEAGVRVEEFIHDPKKNLTHVIP
uniref:DNA2/NAM7 helicase-like C-terminal domain-containing protein n=1 Tax=Acrobeloides nanus TaxID=290746 RepID=A0A914D8F6_9BILA